MKSKIKKTEECGAAFDIEVSRETVAKAFDEVYNEIVKIAAIPGFRVGKAPRELVQKHYNKDAREEVLKRLIPEAYSKAVSEHRINPAGMPEITDVNFNEGDVLTFKARVDTRPEFKLKAYKGIKIDKKKVEVKDEEVDATLNNLREMNAKYLAVEDRSVAISDYVVSDVDCYVDGKKIHKTRENLWLYIDKEALVPELPLNMVGMKIGEEKDIEAKLPEKYPNKELVGKIAKYHVKVKEIKQRKLPSLDNDFAKDLGKDTIDEVKKEIRKELEARGRLNADIEMENKLLGKITDDNVFNVPANFVKHQLDHMVENAKKKLLEKGFKKEELDKKDNELKEKFKNDAVKQVRLLFILDEIANAEKIEISDEDVQNAYRSIAAQVGKDEKTVKDYYEKEGLEDNLKDKIREEKTIKFLLDNAQVSEV